MLENALDDYLVHLPDERAFDAPFLALLPALGFFGVHYTHGGSEFGKDFIAKKREGRSIIQYSFQAKRDVAQNDWRDVQNQLLEAVLTPLSHPHFDARKPHQPVLVVTGRLSSNTAVGAANFNAKIEQFKARPLEVWDRPHLVGALSSHGLAGVHRASAQGFQAYGRFYSLYGEAMEGHLSPREIERYSRYWLLLPPDEAGVKADASNPTGNAANTTERVTHHLLLAALEASMLAARCRAVDAHYEALHCHIASWRAVLHSWHCAEQAQEASLVKHCRALHERVRIEVRDAARDYTNWVERLWREVECNLAACIGGPPGMATSLALSAPVHCAQFVETLGLRFRLAESQSERTQIVSLLEEFVRAEPNCAYPIAERYAVSLVWPLLALGESGHGEVTRDWLHRAAVWLCDRHEAGAGLARLEASAEEEAVTLLGADFEFLGVERQKVSLVAPVLADLAAWLGEAELYGDIVNDLHAVGVVPHFFQPCDSEGAFRFEAPDVFTYPRVTYQDALSPFEERRFASHIARDPSRLLLSEAAGLDAFAAVSLLLRDRYFPGLWPPRLSPKTKKSVPTGSRSVRRNGGNTRKN